MLSPPDEDRLFDHMLVDQSRRLAQTNQNEVLQGDNQMFECWTGNRAPLTVDQYDRLMTNDHSKSWVVYLTISMKYTDNLGKVLTTENCGHLYLSNPNVPIDCLNHNR